MSNQFQESLKWLKTAATRVARKKRSSRQLSDLLPLLRNLEEDSLVAKYLKKVTPGIAREFQVL